MKAKIRNPIFAPKRYSADQCELAAGFEPTTLDIGTEEAEPRRFARNVERHLVDVGVASDVTLRVTPDSCVTVHVADYGVAVAAITSDADADADDVTFGVD